eukprot:Hpha_TRINITY_DN15312_c0_g2::TRINITY_DN15312_c0_g2_i1::g.89610::m.89610
MEDPELTEDLYNQFREVFDYIDADGGGSISSSELQKSEGALKRLNNLFSDSKGRIKLNRECFKRMDRNRDGVLTPFELLRELLPQVPPHRLKASYEPLEEKWVEKNPLPPRPKKRAAQESEISPKEDGEEEVLSADDYAYYKECFQSLDADASGQASLSELRVFLEKQSDPRFAQLSKAKSAADWKALDIDRDGYLSFDELLRRCIADRPWRIRRDARRHAREHGLPAGCAIHHKGQIDALSKLIRRKKSTMVEELSLFGDASGPVTNQPKAMARLQPLKKVQYHDLRIRELEERVRDIDRQVQEQAEVEKEKKLKLLLSQTPPRGQPKQRPGILSPARLGAEEINAANNRLYYEALSARTQKRTDLLRSVEKELHPRKGRFLGQHQVTADDIAGLNDRLYDGPMAQKEQRKQETEEKLISGMMVSKQISLDECAESVARLGGSDVKEREERNLKLRDKWIKEPAKKVTSPAKAAESSQRLFAKAQQQEEHRQVLKERHSPSPKSATISPRQVAALVERMTTPK